MDNEILLACRDASLGYEGKAVWEHLDFQVRRGDYICIVGENGSGKSTLLKSLLGLLRPLSGRIERGAGLKGGAIGYLPQQTRAQKDFPATVTMDTHGRSLHAEVLEASRKRLKELLG